MNRGRTKKEEADLRSRMITIDIRVPLDGGCLAISKFVDPLMLVPFGFGIITTETERAVDELENAYERKKREKSLHPDAR